MVEYLKNINPMDNEDFISAKWTKFDSKIKIAVYLDCAYFFAKMYINGKEYTDSFNDKEPYDNETHIFYIPENDLKDGETLYFTAFDSSIDGDQVYIEIEYKADELVDAEKIKKEYNSKIEIKSTESENIADGVIYKHLYCEDKDSSPVYAFLLEVETSKISLYTGTPNDGYESKHTVATVPSMIDSAVNNGINVVAASNADFFDMFGDGSPSGLCVKNGTVIANENSKRPFVAMKKDGSAVIVTLDEISVDEIESAVSGLEMIVKDGKMTNDCGILEPFSYVRHPRTVVGIDKSEKLFILVVDGRIPEYSNGATLVDLAEMIISFGADRAINLDGGGSSVIYTKNGDGFELRNNPADLAKPRDKLIRKEFNSILLVQK